MTTVIGPDNSVGEKVKPLYGELRGLCDALAQTMTSTDEAIGESDNATVDELIKTTGQEYYSKFKTEIHTDQFGNLFTHTHKLKALSTSLLSRLNQEYFSDEPSTLKSRTSTSKEQQRVLQTFNISGGYVHTGNGDIVQNVTVKDIVFHLSEEIEKLPKSPEKASALQALKTITTNEAFSNVLGASVGAFLSSVLSAHGVGK